MSKCFWHRLFCYEVDLIFYLFRNNLTLQQLNQLTDKTKVMHQEKDLQNKVENSRKIHPRLVQLPGLFLDGQLQESQSDVSFFGKDQRLGLCCLTPIFNHISVISWRSLLLKRLRTIKRLSCIHILWICILGSGSSLRSKGNQHLQFFFSIISMWYIIIYYFFQRYLKEGKKPI